MAYSDLKLSPLLLISFYIENHILCKRLWHPLTGLYLTTPPLQRHIIGFKWVFRIKKKADGSIDKYKARSIAKGFSKVPDFDFTKRFSPVVKLATIRLILTVAVSRN